MLGMNGAEALVRTLVGAGVEVCFTNPGTSEMHFVAALDRVEGMRPILTLFEGVASGAADGYGRMAGKPASTLLHLGPGLANGLANFHNARKARTPIVNLVGDHAVPHQQYDAPLSADVEGFARPASAWVRSARETATLAQLGAEAVAAAMAPPGGVAVQAEDRLRRQAKRDLPTGSSMVVGIGIITLRLHDCRSLKGKRGIVKSLINRIRNNFNVSMAEVDFNDVYHKAAIGFTVVGNSGSMLNSKMDKIFNMAEDLNLAEIIDTEMELIHL